MLSFLVVVSILGFKCCTKKDNEITIHLKKSTLNENSLDNAVGYSGSRLLEKVPNAPAIKDSNHYKYARLVWRELPDTVLIVLNSGNEYRSDHKLYIKTNSFKYIKSFRFNSIDTSSTQTKLTYSTDLVINHRKRKLGFILFPDGNFYIYRFEDLRVGTLNLNSESFKIAVIMQFEGWNYNDITTKNILLDLDHNGTFTLQSEVDSTGILFSNENFESDIPFPVSGKHYKAFKIENDGTKLSLEKVIEDTLPSIGFHAPDFSLISIDGDTLRNFKDKIIVLHFWAITCPPCEIVRPELNVLHEKYSNENNVLFYSAAMEDQERVKEFLKSHPFSYKIASIDDKLKCAYNINAYPRDIIIDKNGIIIFDETGGIKGRGDVLYKVIENAL